MRDAYRTAMSEYPAEGEAEEPTPKKRKRNPNLVILLGFLGVFLVLLIVFRTVLFPFLMAMFVAYLIEPVVAWFTKSRLFGIRWTRGPAILLIYCIVVGLLGVGGWFGFVKAGEFIRSAAAGIEEASAEPVARLRVSFEGKEMPADGIILPAGSILASTRNDELLPYKTRYGIRINDSDTEATVLADVLIPESQPDQDPYEVAEEQYTTQTLRLVTRPAPPGADAPALPDGLLALRVDGHAKGLEIVLERQVISPIIENLHNAGLSIQPTTSRAFIAHKAEALGQDLPGKLAETGLKLASKFVLGVYMFFLILMLTAFIVTDRRGISDFFESLPPPRYRKNYRRLVKYVDDGLAGVIRGQLMICVVNGILTWIGMMLLGIKGAFILSLIAGILSLIPIFGTIVSSIPIVLMGLTSGVDTAVLALLWIVFIHLLEGNVLNPMIMGSHAQMHPVVIVFALLAGEHSFGVWGALLAVPTMSILQACFRFYRHEIEGVPPAEHKGHGEWLKSIFRRLHKATKEPAPETGGSS